MAHTQSGCNQDSADGSGGLKLGVTINDQQAGWLVDELARPASSMYLARLVVVFAAFVSELQMLMKLKVLEDLN